MYKAIIFIIFLMAQTAIADNANTDNPNADNPGADSVINQQRQNELHNLLLQDCGSCHGMTLKGGLGPALTQDAIASRPREFLYTTISEGRPGTPMPPWKTMLSPEEINWLIDTLVRGVNHAK